MINVIFNNEVVFTGTSEEADQYCTTHEWDYTQDTSYAAFEKLCGIYEWFFRRIIICWI